MAATSIDSELLGDQYSTPEMRDVFSDRATIQAWLDTEVALAEAEAALGIIPAEAAEAITAAGDADDYDLDEMKESIARTTHAIVTLVRAIKAKCPEQLGEYVHWGATTQDIMDTGLVLQIRQAEELISTRLQELSNALLDLVVTHATTIMPGRTSGQHALPITFGYKAAVWLDTVRRHQDRLEEMRPRLMVGQYGGAVGTMAALGDQGYAVRDGMMERLGLGVPSITWHTSRDRLVEMVSNMTMIAGLCGQIAAEVHLLQRTEIQELEEPVPPGKVGSSTMPHKRNPAICVQIATLARTTRANLSLAFETLIGDNERDRIGMQVEKDFIPRTLCQVDGALAKTVYLVEGLDVRAENMRENLDITRGLTMSEAVMYALGERMGRQEAHDVLHHACAVAFKESTDMRTALLADESVTEILSEDEIDALLDPEAYTGLAARMARDVAEG